MLDRKGITAYLLITFGITYGIETVLILSGFRITDVPMIYGQYVIAGVMWAPALAAILTLKFITREPLRSANIRFGSWKPYAFTALVIPFCYIVVYGLTWLLRIGQPDWQLTEFLAFMGSVGADLSAAPTGPQILAIMFPITILVAPFLNSMFGFGEELGWRGFLLPKLMPLGKLRAYLILGIIWGLWHAPLVLVGFMTPGHPFLGILVMIGLTTGLGIYINELTMRYRSSILAGWVHGVFNSQAYGIWRILFPDVNPLLGGLSGIVGLLVWLGLGLGALWYFKQRPEG